MHHAPVITRARTTAALVGLAGMLALGACGNQGPDAGASSSPPEVAQSATDTMNTDATSPDATAQTASAQTPALTATLQDVDGEELGTVEFTESEGVMELQVDTSGMEPGFYGLHVHAIGECEPDSAAPDNPEKTGAFLSAVGHLGGMDSQHPEHAGDLPTLLVQESGDAHSTFHTDRFTA